MGMRIQNLKFKLKQISHAQVKDARAAQAAASATVARLERQYIEERNLRRKVDLPPTKPITCTFFICLAHHLTDISSCSCHQSHLPVPCTLHQLSVGKKPSDTQAYGVEWNMQQNYHLVLLYWLTVRELWAYCTNDSVVSGRMQHSNPTHSVGTQSGYMP